MTRFMLPLYLLALMSLTALADDDAVSLAKLTLDHEKLKAWGTQRYTYRLLQANDKTREVLGTLVFSTEVEPDTIILKDELAITFNGKHVSNTILLRCRKDNYLSPLSIDSKGEGDDEFRTFVATVDKGKAAVEENGRERIVDLPEDTVTWEALLRLVTLVPRQKGTRVSFGHSLETSELNLKKDFLLESLGEEKIVRDERDLHCTKFRLTSKQTRPMSLWVKDGILERILLDNRKLIDRVESDAAVVDGPDS